MLPLNVTNGSAGSHAFIIARQLQRFVVAGQGGESIAAARFDGAGAWRERSHSSVFYVAEIEVAKMLLFFWESA